MKSSRLYLWRLRTLCLGGEFFELSKVNPAASMLILGLEREFDVVIGDNVAGEAVTISTRSVLVPVGKPVTGNAYGQKVAFLFLDPLGQDLQHLQKQMAGQYDGVGFDSVHEAAQLATMNEILDANVEPAQAYKLLNQRIFLTDQILDKQYDNLPDSDQRIRKVIEWVKADPCSNIPNQELADRVGLSASQLQRLFKAATGIPIRRYRLWHRLFVASGLIAFGRSLTEAALEAGFSDSSHFNHTFHSMLGIKPSLVLRGGSRTQIYIGGEGD